MKKIKLNKTEKEALKIINNYSWVFLVILFIAKLLKIIVIGWLPLVMFGGILIGIKEKLN